MGEITFGETAPPPPPPPAKPTISVPSRGPMESFTNGFGGLGFSPGPITLVSSFFAEQGSLSFSQLLGGADAMISPLGKEKIGGNNSSSGEGGGGYKRSRPESLVVPQPQPTENLSSMFTIPAGLTLTPSGLLSSPGFLSPVQYPFGMSQQQALAHVTAQASCSQSYIDMQTELQRSSSSSPAEALASGSSADSDEALLQQEENVTELESAKIESSSEVYKSNKRVAGDNQAGDGYNWRKYGQKNVKASGCRRSYYKCSNPHCPVKKKVERTLDGSLSEIIYRGQHNHDPPQPNKRAKDEMANRTGLCEPVNSKVSGHLSIHSHNNDDELVVVDDVVPDAKRRSLDVGPIVSHRTMTESRIVVHTRSEVDLLDDGYKWRKYGQKVVKGNIHPRSYYKCTYPRCAVRKHVERASSDPKAVITSYEGKHNHEIPTGKCSSNANAQTRRTQKIASEHPTRSREVKFDPIPATLYLKEKEIAA